MRSIVVVPTTNARLPLLLLVLGLLVTFVPGLPTPSISPELILPLVLPRIIERYGWQAGFMSIGAAALVALPFVLLFLRERRVVDTVQESPQFGLSFRNIRRTRAFWRAASSREPGNICWTRPSSSTAS